MDKLAKELWCINCDKSLSLRHLVSEKQIGLASRLRVQCQSCHHIIIVETSSKTGEFHDTNLKFAIGKIRYIHLYMSFTRIFFTDLTYL